MRLSDLLKNVRIIKCPAGLLAAECADLTEDSRKVAPGTVFFCQVGAHFDGHDFASKALELGAAAVVTGRELGLVNEIVVEDPRAAYAFACSNYFGSPEKKLKLIGVTGTNGKSSTTHYIYEMLKAFGVNAGLIGTLGTRSGSGAKVTNNTTPESYELERIFAGFVRDGAEYVVMEVSSQGLALDRVESCRFLISAFTNLTEDHLDFHGSFDNYAEAKAKLFGMSDISVINIDDPYANRMLDAVTGKKVTISALGDADMSAADLKIGINGFSYELRTRCGNYRVRAPVFGRFSVYNTLTALAVMCELGFDIAGCVDILPQLPPVKGRMEPVDVGGRCSVYIDYAHTPDALENVLSALRELAVGRVITVFGCGGDRDPLKRPIMGAVAAKYSDLTIVTSDNPRTEDPERIIDDITAGMDAAEFERIVDRRDAIKRALDIAGSDDVVLLAGKGHEDYLIIGKTKYHFDEREVVADIISGAGNGK